MKNVLNGFKEFIMRGNAIDLAVGVIIGAAFSAVVSAIVENLFTPLIAAIFGEPDLSSVLSFTINGAAFSIEHTSTDGDVRKCTRPGTGACRAAADAEGNRW